MEPISLDTLTNPPLTGTFSLCYSSKVEGHANVLVSGANYLNISEHSGNAAGPEDDEYPQWSPDGRYIAFRRSAPIYGPFVHVFDLVSRKDTDVTADGGLVASLPQWTPDGQLCVAYQCPIGSQVATYLMRPTGSGKRKILDLVPKALYFYDDSYRFVYWNAEGTCWYKTDLDHTVMISVLETPTAAEHYITVRDWDGSTGEFLVNTNTISGISTSALATYNVETRQLNLVLSPEGDLGIALQRYSDDRRNIVFVEHNSSVQYLSVLACGKKTRLVRLTNSSGFSYGYAPMHFSPDGQFVAFNEDVLGSSGQWVSFSEYVYVVEIATRCLRQIDSGVGPSWDPRLPN